MNSQKLIIVSGLIFIGGCLSSCAPTLFMGATTGVATTLAEERGLGEVISDTEIKARILSLYNESEYPLNSSIEVVVRQGKVLLTGIVDISKVQIEAARLAWLAKGVKEVHDEIKVGKDRALGTLAKDSWISTQLRTKILFDEKINSINYTLHTIEGVVYLMGIAKTQAELDHIIYVARAMPDVKKVVSYVHLSQVSPFDPTLKQSPSSKIGKNPGDPSYEEEPSAYKTTEPIPLEQESLSQPNTHSAFD